MHRIANRARGAGRALAALPAGAAGLLLLGACYLNTPHYVEPRMALPEPIEAPPVLVVSGPRDAREFTTASNRAPVPSVQGDPADAALTARVIGRRRTATGFLGSNIVLAPDQTVAGLVERAVVTGLRSAGIDATSGPETDTALPRLEVVVQELWLMERIRSGAVAIDYRARVDLVGDWPRFREGRTLTARGSVSAGGLDTVLWRRTLDRALADIALRTSEAASPGETAQLDAAGGSPVAPLR